MHNPFQAIAAVKSTKATRAAAFPGYVQVAEGHYPATPATWPNRAIRRAVMAGRKLPSEWAAFFQLRPELRQFIRTGRMPGVKAL